MKTERRHELQTNQLADWLGHQIERIKPYFKAILGVLAALIVLSFAYAFVQQREYHRAGAVWGEYLGALRERDPDDQVQLLLQVADKNANTPAGLWAAQTEADIDLERGARLLFTDRDEAIKTLERAEKNYEKVEREAQRNPMLLERARFGLAQAYECQGMLQKAKEKYDVVVKANPSGAVGKMAAQRAATVENKDIIDFYAWFEKQKPAPIRRPGGLGLPGTGPQTKLDDLPDRPNLDFPGFGRLDSTPPPSKPAGEDSSEKPGDATETPPAKDSPKPESPTDAPTDKPESKPADKPSDKPSESPTEKPEDKPDEKPAEKPGAP